MPYFITHDTKEFEPIDVYDNMTKYLDFNVSSGGEKEVSSSIKRCS